MLSKLRSPTLRHLLRRGVATGQESGPQKASGDFGSAFESRKDQFESGFRDFVESRRQKNTTQKYFTHELDDEHHPLNFSNIRTVELALDMVGPEMVSPHYEPFMASRRFALTSLAALFGISYLGKISDLNWILQSTYSGLIFYLVNYFVIFEGVKYLHMLPNKPPA